MRIISVNLRTNENLLKIDENAKYEDILKEIDKRLIDLKKLYGDEKTPIKVTGKALKNSEMEEIKKVINKYLDVEVNFDMPKELGLYGITKTFNQSTDISKTKFHKGSLRSGTKLEEEGSLVIIGDVNSGAEVMATENIIVLGSLRGLAHAGAKGNKKAIIATSSLEAVQVRIANVIKEIDKDDDEIHKKQAYIFVEGNKIKIE